MSLGTLVSNGRLGVYLKHMLYQELFHKQDMCSAVQFSSAFQFLKE